MHETAVTLTNILCDDSDCDSPLTLTNYTMDYLDKQWADDIDFVICACTFYRRLTVNIHAPGMLTTTRLRGVVATRDGRQRKVCAAQIELVCGAKLTLSYAHQSIDMTTTASNLAHSKKYTSSTALWRIAWRRSSLAEASPLYPA